MDQRGDAEIPERARGVGMVNSGMSFNSMAKKTYLAKLA